MRMITLALCCALLLTGCEGKKNSSILDRSQGAQITMAEGGSNSNGLCVTNGNVVIKQGNPGIAFAFATLPGNAKVFTYVLLFGQDFPNGGVATQSGGDELTANTSHTLKAFGNECKVDYRVELDAKTKGVKTETTTVADKTFDPSKGRVYLIDMKSTPPTVTQLNLELPAKIPNLEKTESTERFANEILSRLRKADKTVDSFCLRIESDAK